MTEKIIARDALTDLVRDLRATGVTIVTTNGSFDLLHVGHVAMLHDAKSLGDVLIVGVNSDLSVRRYKGKHRPICPQEHRVQMLAALTCTDYITLFDELTPLPLLEIIQPVIHVNSPEHGQDCVEREVVERYGGRIHLSQLIAGMSTTQLLRRIVDIVAQESRRGVFVNPGDLLQADEEQLGIFFRQIQALNVDLFGLESSAFQNQCIALAQQHGVGWRQLTHPLTDLNQIDALVEQHDLSLAKSIVISNESRHILMGRAVNCKTVLLMHSSVQPDLVTPEFMTKSHYQAENLVEALKWFR